MPQNLQFDTEMREPVEQHRSMPPFDRSETSAADLDCVTQPGPTSDIGATLSYALRFQRARLNGRQPLCNGREEALHFFPQVCDRLAIARQMPQQASLKESIKQRIEGAPGDDRLSAAK